MGRGYPTWGENRPGRPQQRCGRLLYVAKRKQNKTKKPIEFYEHAHHWENRLITGDSLLVMNSLLEKEGMAVKLLLRLLE